MTTTIIRNNEISRPTTTRIKSSILDHATVEPVESFGLRNESGLWPSYNCLDTLVPTPMCPDPTLGDDGNFKQFSGGGWVPGFSFAVHGGIQCSPVGLDKADFESELARIFELNEGKGVEQALLLNRFVANPLESDSLPNSPSWEDPIDLTPGCPVTVGVALALLEGYARSIYAGVPTLHIPAAVGSLLNERLIWEGDKAFTRLGSKVAMGGGYDNPDMLETGEWDLHATGEVFVEKSTEINVNVGVLPSDGSGVGSGENGLADNTHVALVEKMFRVGVDCFVAKATATIWDC
jgi:hypothetical protein